MISTNKTVLAVLWSAADVIGRQGIQFLVVIVLARLVAPEEFGVIAITMVFVSVANIIIDSGFSSALIQRQRTTSEEESTIFYFNAGMGAVFCLLLCAAAAWIAGFFDQPILRILLIIMAVNLLVNSLGSVQMALLVRELNFKAIMKIGVISSLLSGLLAITLAWKGFGVWSLAYQTVSSTVITVLLLWSWHPWRPTNEFSVASLKSFFKFGSYLTITGLVDALHNNLNSIMIGKLYTVKDVGFYDRAQRTQFVPTNIMMGIVNRVSFPVFSSVADDKARLSRGLRKAQKLVMFVNVPVMIAIIILAVPLVNTLFGPQWLASAPILQVLGLVGIMWPLHVLNLNVLMAQGRSDLFFRIMLIKKSVAIGLTIAASFLGIMAIAWAQVLSSVLSFFVNAYYTREFLAYGAIEQLHDIASYVLASLPMGIIIWTIYVMTDLADSVKLLVSAGIGAIVYLVSCRLLQDNSVSDMMRILLVGKDHDTKGIE